MRPALSVILLTTLCGAGQGLFIAAFAVEGNPTFRQAAFALSALLAAAGLVASFFHLGRIRPAWRAASQWRTSWLSREVIALPAFIAVIAAWWLAARDPLSTPSRVLLPLASLVGAVLLWYCTAMIYACLRFIEEWAHPLTIVNFILLGLSSGLVLATAVAALAGEQRALALAAPVAAAVTLVAWAARTAAWHACERARCSATSCVGSRDTRSPVSSSTSWRNRPGCSFLRSDGTPCTTTVGAPSAATSQPSWRSHGDSSSNSSNWLRVRSTSAGNSSCCEDPRSPSMRCRASS